MNSPSSMFVRPRQWSEPTEDKAEMMEEAMDRQRAAARDAARTNKVASFLGQKTWRTDRTWPFLWWPTAGRQLSAGMYFPALNLAVDRFPRPDSMQRQEAAFKAGKFKEHQIRYIALMPETSINELKQFLK